MALGDPEKLAKAWATAPSLHAYSVEKAEQKWRESTPGWPLPETHAVFSVDWYFRTQEFQKRLEAARKSTIKELIAGQIVGLGRPSDSKGIEQVPESFWIDAVVDDWPGGTASCDGRTFTEVSVVPGSASELDQSAAGSTAGQSLAGRGLSVLSAGSGEPNQPEVRRRRGPPSKAPEILAAISAAEQKDPTLWDRTPDKRLKMIYSELALVGLYPNKQSGLSQKTIQKYETAVRPKNK